MRVVAVDLAHDDALDAIARATEDLDLGLLVVEQPPFGPDTRPSPEGIGIRL